MPFISYSYAAGKADRMKGCILFIGKIMLIILVICSCLMVSFPNVFMKAFINDAATVGHGTIMLRGFGIGVTFLSIDFLAVAVFQAIGKGKYALVFAILRKIVFEIPMLFLLNSFWPLYGLAFAQTVSEFVFAILGIIMHKNIIKTSENQ